MENTVYNDIQKRTNGEIYIGVVGPVRSGKSTFIKRFMDLCVLPEMGDEYRKKQAVDELPQSGTGKTITTTEPKFIPSQAAEIEIGDNIKARMRLIDCVGYMVNGAVGHMENEKQRMVRTPWFKEEIPFVKAAEIGTKKVIEEHSTVGIVVTSDGSFTDIPMENYIPALENTLNQLSKIKKPFVVLYNTQKPYSDSSIAAAQELSEKYNVTVIPVNIAQLKKEDIDEIMEKLLMEFPISAIEYYLPEWVSLLEEDHPLRQTLLSEIKEKTANCTQMKDIDKAHLSMEDEFIEKTRVDHVNLSDGSIKIELTVNEKYYYEMLSDLLGIKIEDEYNLLQFLETTAKMKKEYETVLHALDSVRQKGYGVVTPQKQEITLMQPEIIHHGNKYGVKIKALSPSVHMIRATIETDIAPIVGTKEQAEDLIRYIGKDKLEGTGAKQDDQTLQDSIWETNIFGKTVEQMVQDGISAKLSMIGEESQMKLQDTMQKIVNDTNGAIICIIL